MVVVPNRNQVAEYTPEELIAIAATGNEDEEEALDGYDSLDDFVVPDTEDGEAVWDFSDDEDERIPYLYTFAFS